jgi:hypothetical protein
MSLFDTTDLATDADLTAWESRMPNLGQKSKGTSGSSPYDGKRVLAKNFLAKQLIKRGVNLDDLADPSQLTDAAVFKELDLIFTDMSLAPDDLAAKKALHYSHLFNDELELVILRSVTQAEAIHPTISSIPLLRA